LRRVLRLPLLLLALRCHRPCRLALALARPLRAERGSRTTLPRKLLLDPEKHCPCCCLHHCPCCWQCYRCSPAAILLLYARAHQRHLRPSDYYLFQQFLLKEELLPRLQRDLPQHRHGWFSPTNCCRRARPCSRVEVACARQRPLEHWHELQPGWRNLRTRPPHSCCSAGASARPAATVLVRGVGRRPLRQARHALEVQNPEK